MTPEALGKLDEAFASGATDLQACFYAGISKDAFYDYQKKTEGYSDRKAGLKAQLGLIAKNQVAKAIRDGDVNKATWYLERKEKAEFSIRTENTGANGEPLDLSLTVKHVKSD